MTELVHLIINQIEYEDIAVPFTDICFVYKLHLNPTFLDLDI